MNPRVAGRLAVLFALLVRSENGRRNNQKTKWGMDHEGEISSAGHTHTS